MSHAIAVCHGAFGRAALYELDRTIITHAHREGHLIFYVGGATALCTTGDSEHVLDADTAVAVSPWEPHSFNIPNGATTTCLVLYIKPMWFLENSSSAEFALRFGAPVLRIDGCLRQLVSTLTMLLLQNEDHAAFNDELFRLTHECFTRSWAARGREERDGIGRRFNDFRVRRSLRLIQEQVGDDFAIDELARDVGLSRPHFFKLFKQSMGVTPNVYINTLRSERAIDDLLLTEKTVTDIAFDLGFSSQASFTRFFSSNVGIAPSEYRRVAHVSATAFPMIGDRSRLSGMREMGATS